MFNIWGMNLDHDLFQVSKLSEDQKQSKKKVKGSSPKIQEFFSRNLVKTKKGPNIIQRLDVDQSQIIGGGTDVDHSQIIRGDAVKWLGRYIPPSPRVSAPLPVVLFKACMCNVRFSIEKKQEKNTTLNETGVSRLAIERLIEKPREVDVVSTEL